MSDEKANRLWDFIEYGFTNLDETEDFPTDDDFEIAVTYHDVKQMFKEILK